METVSRIGLNVEPIDRSEVFGSDADVLHRARPRRDRSELAVVL